MSRSLALLAAIFALTTILLFAVAPAGWTWYFFFNGGNHVFAFILVALALKALWPGMRNLHALAGLLALGTLIEIAQRIIPLGHAAEATDVLFDGMGAVVGLVLAAAVAAGSAASGESEPS